MAKLVEEKQPFHRVATLLEEKQPLHRMAKLVEEKQPFHRVATLLEEKHKTLSLEKAFLVQTFENYEKKVEKRRKNEKNQI